MNTLHELEKLILAECQEDHVGLWWIVNEVKNSFPSFSPQEVHSKVVELLRKILAVPGIKAGFPTPNGKNFEAWQLAPEQVIEKVQVEWAALGRDPTLGEVAWFTRI